MGVGVRLVFRCFGLCIALAFFRGNGNEGWKRGNTRFSKAGLAKWTALTLTKGQRCFQSAGFVNKQTYSSREDQDIRFTMKLDSSSDDTQ